MNRIKYAPSNGPGSAQGKECQAAASTKLCRHTAPQRTSIFPPSIRALCQDPCPASFPAQHPHRFLSPQNCQNASSPTSSVHTPNIISGPKQDPGARETKKKGIVPTLKGPNHGEVEGGMPTARCMGDWVSSGSGTARAFLHWRAREDSLTQSLMTGKGSGGSGKG